MAMSESDHPPGGERIDDAFSAFRCKVGSVGTDGGRELRAKGMLRERMPDA